MVVTIDSLYKVTEGGQSDIFHRHADGSFDQACCFTIYHGNHMESLDLVTTNTEEARTWITGLRYLMAGISDEDSLAKRQRTHDQYPSYQSLQFLFLVMTNLQKEENILAEYHLTDMFLSARWTACNLFVKTVSQWCELFFQLTQNWDIF